MCESNSTQPTDVMENDKAGLHTVTDIIPYSFYRSVDFENLVLGDIKEGTQTGNPGDIDSTISISFTASMDKFEQYKGLRAAHNVPGQMPFVNE
jgi:hypothetical protein